MKLLKIAGVTTAAFMLLVAAFVVGMFVGTETDASNIPGANQTSIDEKVGEAAQLIDELALKPSSEESMTAGAIEGMLESLEDSHAMYFDAKHFEYFNQETEGMFYGIGVTISNVGDDLVIQTVMKDTPAEAAGLKADDVIVTIDGETRPRWDTDEAVLLIRGDAGTTVKLGIRRNGSPTLRDFTVTRAKITMPNIESELLDGDVGYIRLYEFSEPAAKDLRKAIEDLGDSGARGYILDLRDNPGGLLSSSVDVSSLFVADGVIVTEENRLKIREEFRANGRLATDAPLVVLINGNSASASEIVAGALQDYGRATLVGEQSFGKGSVQQIAELSYGGAVKLTIAHYLTPKNRAINGIGLTPDVVVPMDAELQKDKATDKQLQKAIDVLKDEL